MFTTLLAIELSLPYHVYDLYSKFEADKTTVAIVNERFATQTDRQTDRYTQVIDKNVKHPLFLRLVGRGPSAVAHADHA